MPIVSFKVIPITGEKSVSKYIVEAVKILKEEGYDPIVTPDTSVITMESLTGIGELVERIHGKIKGMGVERIVTIIMIDDRVDKPLRDPLEMVRRVEENLRG